MCDVMCEVTRGDLLGQQCELFLDDLIIFASEEDEFVRNLEMCLDRLEKAGITCNPENVDSVMTKSNTLGT